VVTVLRNLWFVCECGINILRLSIWHGWSWFLVSRLLQKSSTLCEMRVFICPWKEKTSLADVDIILRKCSANFSSCCYCFKFISAF